jgi:acetyltransferase-like isoleucine patch superfamily enzyme
MVDSTYLNRPLHAILSGSIVGACSLVAKDIDIENSISIGVPARFIKKRF